MTQVKLDNSNNYHTQCFKLNYSYFTILSTYILKLELSDEEILFFKSISLVRVINLDYSILIRMTYYHSLL